MRRRKVIFIVLGLVFCLAAGQAALAPIIGGLLRRSLSRQAMECGSLTVAVAPLSWPDLFRGRVPHLEMHAREIAFAGPRLSRLDMTLRDIRLATSALIRGETVVTSLGPSRVQARVSASALNEYRRRAYPAVPVHLRIDPGRVSLLGSLSLFGQVLTVQTGGRLQVRAGDLLRYVPESLEVAGRRVPASWLASYGGQLSLEFPLALPLPLTLREVEMGAGYASLAWENPSVP